MLGEEILPRVGSLLLSVAPKWAVFIHTEVAQKTTRIRRLNPAPRCVIEPVYWSVLIPLERVSNYVPEPCVGQSFSRVTPPPHTHTGVARSISLINIHLTDAPCTGLMVLMANYALQYK